jgi:hypothetical protein
VLFQLLNNIVTPLKIKDAPFQISLVRVTKIRVSMQDIEQPMALVTI